MFSQRVTIAHVNTLISTSKRTLSAGIPLVEPSGRIIHLRWRLIVTALLAILLILLTLLADPFKGVRAASSTQSANAPLVVAFYYTWFDEQTWTHDKLSDFPAETYASRDRGVMGRHIDQARNAGIDAFIVAWYGPTKHNNQTEENLSALLDEAASRNFKIGILFETTSPFFSGEGDVSNALRHALSTHAAHPAYLRADGRPVIFFWRPTIYGVDTWRGIRSQVDSQGSSVWIAEGVDTNYLAVFDGHHLYSNTWNPPADLGAVNQKFANLVGQHGGGKMWVATVMPGYNDVKIRPGSGFAQDREGGAYYDRSWQAALASNPHWIVINSFNEWPEGSYIEPSQAHGDRFLQQTSRWGQQFKAGVRPAVPAPTQAAPLANAEPVANVVSAGTTPVKFTAGDQGTVAVSLLNLRAGPSTTHSILSSLPSGTALTVVDPQQNWLQVTVEDQTGWVFASMVTKSSNGSTRAKTVADLVGAGQVEPGQAGGDPSSPSTAGETRTVAVSLLNLRGGPGTDQPILAQLALGNHLLVQEIASQHPEWILVRVPQSAQSAASGLQGWVYASMVE